MMIQTPTRTNKIVSVLALLTLLFAIATANNCVDNTNLTVKRKTVQVKEIIPLCEWASSSELSSKLLSKLSSSNSSVNNKKQRTQLLKKRLLKKQVKERCLKTKSDELVKFHCPCACAEFVTTTAVEVEDDAEFVTTFEDIGIDVEYVDGDAAVNVVDVRVVVNEIDDRSLPITLTSSCPVTDVPLTLLSGNSCTNNSNSNDDEVLTCNYNYINTSCDANVVVNTPIQTCECINDGDGGDSENNNPIWECYSFAMEPCEDDVNTIKILPLPLRTSRPTGSPTQPPVTRNLRS